MPSYLILREWANAAFFILCVCFAVTLARFLWWEIKINGWKNRLRIDAAIALLILSTGEGLTRAVVWLVLKIRNTGGSTAFAEETSMLFFIAASIGAVGMVRCIAVFSPNHCGQLTWIVSSLLAIGFVLMSALT